MHYTTADKLTLGVEKISCGKYVLAQKHVVRLDGLAHGILTKTVHKTLPGSLFVGLKLGLVQLFSSQISSKFTAEVAFYPLCMPSSLLIYGVNVTIVQDFK